MKPGKSVLSFFENERIGNSYSEQLDKTLDLSLDLG